MSSARSASAGASALIESYLPSRREFWVAQCARSALALKDGARPRDETWKHLALVGRDLADDMPLSRIPARLVGMGIRPEHVQTPGAAPD